MTQQLDTQPSSAQLSDASLPAEAPTEKTNANQTSLPKLKPMVRYFSGYFFKIFLMALLTVAFLAVFFYQYSLQTRTTLENQFYTAKNQAKLQQRILVKKVLLDQMLMAKTASQYIQQHEQLIEIDKQLLQSDAVHSAFYKRWLNVNKANREMVVRIQNHSVRNQQLKQSNVIQLQLILFSLEQIVKKKSAQVNSLYLQLLEDKITDTVTASRAMAYAQSLKQLQQFYLLQQFFTSTLAYFEQLSIHTSLENFELLRADIVAALEKSSQVLLDKTNDVLSLNKQIMTFEKIALSEQRTLAKWQGHLRLVAQYHQTLAVQNQQLQKIIDDFDLNHVLSFTEQSDVIVSLLAQYNIHTDEKTVSIVLLLAAALCFISFVFLLLGCRKKIKYFNEQSLKLITDTIHYQSYDQKNVQGNNQDKKALGKQNVTANCLETQIIIEQIKQVTVTDFSTEEVYLLQAHNQKQAEHAVIESEQKQQLINELEQLKADISNTAQQQLSEEIKNSDKLTAMVVQAMLQYQNSALVAESDDCVSDAQVSIAKKSYRQLTRIFDWLRQHQVRTYLASNNAVLMLSDVNLVDEIHGALLNALTEAQRQQNQVMLSCDGQLMLKAKLDARLFNRLMIAFCQLLLAEQFNAKLLIKLQISDKSVGQQRVHFCGDVCLKHDENSKQAQLPELLLALLTNNDDLAKNKNHHHLQSTSTSELVLYFQALLEHQFAENVSAQVTEHGYQLTFDLPLTMAQNDSTLNKISSDDYVIQNALNEVNTLLISADEMITKVLVSQLHHAGAVCDQLSDVNYLAQQLSIKKQSKQLFNLIIVAADKIHELAGIYQSVSSLPHALQPKIMVLQAKKHAFSRYGLYSQAANPLCEQQLIVDIKQLLTSECADNQLLTAEQCQPFQYLSTPVEVLLAVASPQKWQTLLRILQWFGLQVRVISQAQSQHKHWQTGRYLLLLSEFEQSPFVDMAIGKTLQRGVFSLSQVMSEDERYKHWKTGHIDNVLDLTHLAELLSPWLKVKGSFVVKPVPQKITKLTPTVTEGKAIALATAIDMIPSFNVTRYVQHQASPELAMFMLEEYVQSNYEEVATLSDALEKNNVKEAQAAVETLMMNAKILAADDLQLLCQQWQSLLITDFADEKAQTLLDDTTQQLSLIETYAETV